MGASFAQSLVFGWQANPKASLEELCQSARVCDVEISPQGLQERLNSQQANAFLQQLLLKGVTYMVQNQCEREDLLASFNGVYLQDSSQVELPSCFQTIWQGQSKNQAVLKLQTVLDYQHGCFDLTLASGRDHVCPLQTVTLPKESLRLADFGYFKVKVFAELNEQGVWWVSRVPARSGIWQGEQVIHVANWLKEQQGDCIDQPIELTAQRLPCRLLAIRVPDEVAKEEKTGTQSRTQTEKQPTQARDA
ncbi:MAG: hypothetical protein H6657_11050 [Ardenticatenaceae bacterium]|nr:hypothetical protein [Ardenticatenaceae bacterium]